jgi:hypothetical protein
MDQPAAYDLLLFSPDKGEAAAFAAIGNDFDYKFMVQTTLDELMDAPVSTMLLVVSAKAAVDGIQVTELMQASRQMHPDAYLILIVSKQLPKKESEVLQKLGADMILLDSEVENSKASFAVNQILKTKFLPLKPTDLVAEKAIPFTLYHLMPQRKKFLPIMRPGDLLDTSRLDRLKMSSEYYFSRSDALLYKKYVDENVDKSAKGLAKRCRANLLALQEEFTHLVFQLTDESDRASFASGQELLKKCTKLCEDLLMNLAEFPKAWEIVNNSAIGTFGSLERAPAIAAYCGLLGLQSELPRIPEVMLVSLLVDIGILSLPASFTRKVRGQETLSSAEETQLKGLPQTSLDMILRKKLALDEKSRSVLLSTYQIFSEDEDLRLEPQLIRFARELDQLTQVRMGQMAPQPVQVMEGLAKSPEFEKNYTPEFMTFLREKILPEMRLLK